MIYNRIRLTRPTALSLFAAFIAFTFLTCCQPEKKPDSEHENSHNLLKYAQGARLFQQEQGYLLQIIDPWNSNAIISEYFLLYGSDFNQSIDSTRDVVQIPVNALITLSSTQWSPLVQLGVDTLVKGISEADYVRNERMRQLIDAGRVIEVSANGVFDAEKIVSLQPSLILYSPFTSGVPDVLLHTGFPLLPWPDYFESDPLGRAEWLRILGVLTGTREQADAWFFAIEKRYNALKYLATDVQNKPTVFSDKAFSGQWFVPGGQSYIAAIFRDAGADYVWKDNDSKASFPLDIESILNKAQQADFWRIAQAANDDYSYEQIAQENEIYRSFKAFQQHQILFCNTAKTAYFERSQFEPDVILSDFVHLFHPELLPDHQPVYYNLLP